MPLNNHLNIAIIGFGDLGKQFYLYLKEAYPLANFVAFDDFATYTLNNEVQLFAFQAFKNKEFESYHFYAALGYKRANDKKTIIDWLVAQKRAIPAFIHTSAILSPQSSVADGVFIFPGVILDTQTIIEIGTILHLGVTVAHNSIIGNCTYLSPKVVVSGFSKIGDFTFVGSGTIISNGVTIGKNVCIGIGSVITENIADDASVIGNPFKIISKPLKIQ